ncbi:MAG: hypothetical protein Q7T74_00140 [Candidatus Saccharibacteria bacterium]|nr:hypothetical protein [Candidatus Saccharibacteria bacterium]
MKKLLSLIAIISLTSCSTFNVTQTDESPERTITSHIKATAFCSSAQSIAKIKAIQTDKTQSFGTDAVGQQGATNVVEALKAIGGILQMVK